MFSFLILLMEYIMVTNTTREHAGRRDENRRPGQGERHAQPLAHRQIDEIGREEGEGQTVEQGLQPIKKTHSKFIIRLNPPV